MLKTKIPDNRERDKQIMQHILDNIIEFNDVSIGNDASIGYIAMECASKSENFVNLGSHIQQLQKLNRIEEIKKLKALAIYEIINLALSGDVQGDHH
jgi:hypothetical protein